jgi:hypothetical protein
MFRSSSTSAMVGISFDPPVGSVSAPPKRLSVRETGPFFLLEMRGN